ncbi:MAG: ABC transporter ATP-binding protein, partial [Candidatus Binataceae bacterium]
ERHVLDNLPARIEELRALRARLQSLLDDTGFYARNPATFAQVSAAFAKAEAALAEAEGEWLRLAILREESAP